MITCSAKIEGCIPEPRDAKPFAVEERKVQEKIVRRFLGDECSPPDSHDEVFVRPALACCANFRCDQF